MVTEGGDRVDTIGMAITAQAIIALGIITAVTTDPMPQQLSEALQPAP
ncbi:hypothetical protein [Rhizobium mongolense]|uniref:Uncharacterized protein n=1 Tax=Rhizobium mongolense TaxID=57676 RepID=A0A7W6RX34_9HYPH|nr:hypothetical protein [Rhizobium mongolense]MBB4279558.1 hypothetical protein [Rhizobium mongolense]